MCWSTQQERDEQFRATTTPFSPADPGDFRFEVIRQDGDQQEAFLVLMIGDDGECFESFTTDMPFDAIEAAREAQAIPFEERMDIYAQRGW